MSTCETKRGFFILYDCPKEASEQCRECQRKTCSEHYVKEHSLCLECAIHKQGEEQLRGRLDSRALTQRAYKIRNHVMHKKGDSTIYYGKSLNDYYSKYDVRAFDVELSQLAELSDSPDELYFDS